MALPPNSLAPGFSRVFRLVKDGNRFSGFLRWQTAKAFLLFDHSNHSAEAGC
jgi:hypothetical protein